MDEWKRTKGLQRFVALSSLAKVRDVKLFRCFFCVVSFLVLVMHRIELTETEPLAFFCSQEKSRNKEIQKITFSSSCHRFPPPTSASKKMLDSLPYREELKGLLLSQGEIGGVHKGAREPAAWYGGWANVAAGVDGGQKARV